MFWNLYFQIMSLLFLFIQKGEKDWDVEKRAK